MRTLRSEWTKLRSVQSTWITAAATVVIAVGISALGASAQPGAVPGDWDPTAVGFKGLLVAQLTAGLLGVMAITSEYATRTIQTSAAVVPRRGLLLGAKTVVVTGMALVVGLFAAFASFFVVQAMLANASMPHATLADPRVLRAVFGAALYLTLIALLGLALGTLTRSTAGALGALVAISLLVPAVGPALPGPAGEWIGRYWPPTAGANIYAVVPLEGGVAPWLGLGILALAVLYLSVASHALLRFRDI